MKMFKSLLAGFASLFLCSIAIAAPPATPQNLRPAWLHTYTAPAEAFAIWESVPGAESYNVYRSDDANTNWTLIATNVTVPFYSDPFSLFLPSYYTVTAVNGDGESSGAEPVSVFEAWCGGLQVTYISPWNGNVSATNAIVEWVNSHPIGEEGLVEWGPAEAGLTNYIGYAINTNYLPWQRITLTNLTPLTLYQYRITSINPQRGGLRLTNYFTTTDTNHAPVIQYYVFNFQPDTSSGFSIQYWATDVDFPPQNITFQLTQPTNGSYAGPWESWTWEGTRWSLWYTPNPGARGPDQITATASDGVDTVTAVIQFTNWMNTPPLAGYLTTNVVEDTPTLISLPNYDAEGDPVSFEVFTPYGGVVTGTPPNLIFVPDTNRTGEASIYWWASDSYSTNWGWMSINITPVNDRPVAYPSSFFTWEEMTVSIWLNWSDVEYGIPMSAVIVRPPAHGTLSGDIFWMQYTPESNFNGYDSFDFVVREEDGTTSDPATVTIHVISQNDPPTVPAETFHTREDTAVSFTVGAIDADGDLLTYWINSGPFHGTLTGTLPNLTYTPEPGYFGFDTFNYSATDGIESRPNNVTIGVGVNSLPEPTLRRHIFEDGIVRLTWNDLGAQHYNVYRADGTNAPFTLLASNVVATNFNDDTAQWQQPYWYRVRSWDGTNEGQPSLAKFAYPDATGLLNLNQMNWVIGGTTGRVSFSYSLESGIEAIFEYGTDRNYGTTLENTNLLPAQVFGLAGLTPGTVYYFRITTTDAKGNSLVASTNLFKDWFATQPPPIADSQSISIAEDTTGAVTPTGSDANWRPLTFSLVSNPAHGTVSIVSVSGGYYYFYVPAANYFGSDSFTYKANNGELDSLPATVSITVTPVNDAPVASNQSIVMAEDSNRNLVLTGTDVEGGALTYQIIQSPTNGTFVSGTPPNLTYRPATNYFGTDSFKFTVQDSQFASATGTVSITITNINDRPTALAQSVTTPEDASLVIGAVGIDPDGDVLQLIIQTLPTNGTLSLYTTQTVLYTPNANFTGADSFLVRVSDGKSTSLVSVPVNITVSPVNDRPIANAQSVSTPEDTAKAITLTGSDVEGSPLTFQITSGPTHGTLSGSGATRTYTPDANYVGADQFSFVANDGTTNSAAATVSITVTGVNDAPVANAQSLTLAEDTTRNVVLTGTDVEGTALSYSIVSGPTNGALSGTAPNVVYTPNANFNGSDSIVFSVSDGSLSSTNIISLTVTPVNDAPSILSFGTTTWEDVPLTYTVTASDADNDALTFIIVSGPSHGTVSNTGPTFTYTPDPNYVGSDYFIFKANDGTTNSGQAYGNITTVAVNDAPIADAQTVPVNEDTPTTIVLSGSDVDGDTLGYTVLSAPAHGTLSGTPLNITSTNTAFVYTPAPNYHGPDSFTFRVNDMGLFSAPATVMINVGAVNDAPVAAAQTLSLSEDGSLAITLTGSDVDGDALNFSVVTPPVHGVLSGTGANLTYTPEPNYNGADSFTFVANDGATNSAPATVILTVTPVNDTPVAAPQSQSLPEDGSLAITLAGADIDGDALSFTVVTPPAHGALSGTGANLTYTPEPNYNGADSFTFIANDGTTNSAPATVNLTVTPVNDAPIAASQGQALAEDGSLAVTLAGSDIDGDGLSFSIVTPPAHGVLSGTAANLTYTPEPNYNGADSFTFVANDGTTNSIAATVNLTITPANDAPVASAQNRSLPEDGSLAIILAGADIDGDALSFSVVTPPTHGALSGTGGNLTYTPEPNYNGPDTITFVANDGTTNSAPATVNLIVTPVNDAPIANNASQTAVEDASVAATLTASDVDGDALTFSIVSQPTHGTLTGTTPNLVYTPAANYNGSDAFTFRVNDGTVNSADATVSITVTPVNDAPVASAQSRSVVEDGSVAITLTGSDVEGSAITYIIVSGPAHGALSGSAPNVTYTPAADYFGADAFTFKINDGAADSAPAQVSLTVTPMNDAPVANAQSVNTAEDTATPFVLTATDADGDSLTYTVLTTPTHGSLSGTAPNLTYTPAANYFGSDSFTFRVNDGTVNSGTATVSITVLSVNDAPVANAQSVTVTYNTAKAITLTGSDLEGGTLTYAIVSGPTNGALSGTAPNVTYTPTVGSAGADFFTFRVNDGSSNSAAATVSLTTLNPTGIPSAPSGLGVTVPTAIGTLILNWNCSATNEDGFKIERSLSSGSGWSEIATTGINILTYTNSGLTSGTRYYYRVRSYNRLGNSAYSNTVNQKPR